MKKGLRLHAQDRLELGQEFDGWTHPNARTSPYTCILADIAGTQHTNARAEAVSHRRQGPRSGCRHPQCIDVKWQAQACKAVYAGSIPAPASTPIIQVRILLSCYIEPQRHDVRLGWQDIPAVVRVERLWYSRTRGRASYIRSETFLDNTLVAGLGVRHLMLWHQRACVRLPQPQSRSQEYLTDARLKRLAASSVAKRLDSDTSSIAR